jgi:hypothetical protein
MSTQRKIDSARANGAKSHGPITEQGRKTSSMNALKHGLTARTVVLSNENHDEYTVLLESYVDELQPNGPVEMDLVTEMVNAKWQQHRLSNIESQLFEEYMETAKKFSDVASDPNNPTIDHTAGFSFMANSTSLPMLNRMAARFERTYSRALNNLLRLRRVRESNPRVSITKEEKRTQPQDRTRVTNHQPPLEPSMPNPAADRLALAVSRPRLLDTSRLPLTAA